MSEFSRLHLETVSLSGSIPLIRYDKLKIQTFLQLQCYYLLSLCSLRILDGGRRVLGSLNCLYSQINFSTQKLHMTPYVKNVLDQAHEIPLDSQFTGDFDGITFEKHLRID